MYTADQVRACAMECSMGSYYCYLVLVFVIWFSVNGCQWLSQGSMLSWPADSVSSVNWLLGSMEFRWWWNLL